MSDEHGQNTKTLEKVFAMLDMMITDRLALVHSSFKVNPASRSEADLRKLTKACQELWTLGQFLQESTKAVAIKAASLSTVDVVTVQQWQAEDAKKGQDFLRPINDVLDERKHEIR